MNVLAILKDLTFRCKSVFENTTTKMSKRLLNWLILTIRTVALIPGKVNFTRLWRYGGRTAACQHTVSSPAVGRPPRLHLHLRPQPPYNSALYGPRRHNSPPRRNRLPAHSHILRHHPHRQLPGQLHVGPHRPLPPLRLAPAAPSAAQSAEQTVSHSHPSNL